MTRIMLMIVQVFYITPLVNIAHIFTGWLNEINKKLSYKILVGASTIWWAIWLSINDIVFNNTWAITPMQVILSVFGYLCRKRTSSVILFECRRVLEIKSKEVFASHGWTFSSRIAFTWCLTLIQKPFFLFFFETYVFVIKNSYMHSFMQRLEYWNIFPFL
jgi:hypothetical protein